MLDYPDVNHQRLSYASVELGIAGPGPGLKVRGVKSISYKDNVEKAKIWGTGRNPFGRTGGKNDPSGEIEFYGEEFWVDLLPAITRGGSVGYSELAWTITVVKHERLGVTTRDTLLGVSFLGPDFSGSEGPDALAVKVPLSIMGIEWGGVYTAFTRRR